MIAALFAVDEQGGMGKNGSMPWPMNKEDMQWFKRTTEGHVVVMGRKSWNSPDMPHPLPKRHNVVFTNDFMEQEDIFQLKGDVCMGLLNIKENNPDLNVFVIGGANLLIQSKPTLQRIFITRIPGTYDCDTIIDLADFLNGFRLVQSKDLLTCRIEEYETI
jgi:dihydrofolate reductase